jgi:hypothetical protein
MYKGRVEFVCPICRRTIKKDEPVEVVTGPRADTIYYAHSKHNGEANDGSESA